MTVLKLLYLGLDFEALGLSKDMYTNSWLTPAKTIGKSDTLLSDKNISSPYYLAA
jgi:hypothetical protein